MTKSDFTYLLANPGEINRDHVTDFPSIINKFPYFQPARALYLKALKENDSFLYNQELRTTAAYTSDRSVLFDFITSEEFVQNEISDLIQHNLEYLKNIELNDYEDVSAGSLEIRKPVDEAHKANEDQKSGQEFQHVAAGISGQISEAEDKLQIGKPLEFDKTEKHSFSEWLKLAEFKPISRGETEEDEKIDEQAEKETGNDRSKKQELIDRFIENQPVMPKVSDSVPEVDLSKAGLMKSDSLMTETLARIYLEQGNYTKAKHAYRILCLKYPEKSGFFADQIQAIEDLEKK